MLVAAFVTVIPVQVWWDKVTQKVYAVCAHNTMRKTKSPNDFYNLQSPQQQVSGNIKKKKKKKKKNYTINQCPPQFCAASSLSQLSLYSVMGNCFWDRLVHGSFMLLSYCLWENKLFSCWGNDACQIHTPIC